jgi:tetratricopeptide (TPR) repeat protein
MALRFFKKDDSEAGDKSSGAFVRDASKARKFFEHAESMADRRSYDYAIKLYINGLRHDPDNMARHEALREVALRYKASGGKPAGLKERKFETLGKDPVSKMLDAEKIWAKDVGNVQAMIDVMHRAVEADKAEPALHLAEFAHWVGKLAMEFGRGQKKTSANDYLHIRDLFAEIGAFNEAVTACQWALTLKPGDDGLTRDLKDLETRAHLHQDAFAQAGQVGGFRAMVKDMDRQIELEQDDAISKNVSQKDQVIDRRRKELADEPDSAERIERLARALLDKGGDEAEAEALKLLKDGYEKGDHYRLRVVWGDTVIRQLQRQIRVLRQQAEGGDAKAVEALKQARAKLLKFELQEFTDRAAKYPTDMSLRFQLGRRLLQTGQYDEAISAFQDARADGKYRVQSLLYLGMCYKEQGWFDEAVDTLREGMERHEVEDDATGMELQYRLMDALEASAREGNDVEKAREAQKIASKILRTDIRFRDIKDRMDALRSLVTELSTGA